MAGTRQSIALLADHSIVGFKHQATSSARIRVRVVGGAEPSSHFAFFDHSPTPLVVRRSHAKSKASFSFVMLLANSPTQYLYSSSWRSAISLVNLMIFRALSESLCFFMVLFFNIHCGLPVGASVNSHSKSFK